MYSIGEFSKINRISTRTLRHYDEIGLLSPAKTDSWTAYRYYDESQLSEIRRILFLKDLGFSLMEIQALVEGRESEELMMNEREKALTASIRHEKARLKRLREYLGRIHGGKEMTVEIKALPECIVASMRTKVPSYDSYFAVVPKMGEYMKSVAAVCREPAYCFNIYHDGEFRESDIDVEICEAVTEVRKDSDKVKFKIIDSVEKAACLLHRGPYTTIGDSYNLIFEWIFQEGYERTGLPRESYIDGIWNKDNPEEWLTEIQIPVEMRNNDSP